MIPALVFLDMLPLTHNGKIDRCRLPPPANEMPALMGPRDALEMRLMGIWKDVLRIDQIGSGESFFDVGGHSLLALRLLVEIERVFGKRLAVSTLFKAQTIEEMAAVLRQEVSEPRCSLVAMQPLGSRPALFLIPGASGDVLGYAELPRLLGSDQPVYGLQSIGLESNERPLDRIEEIARRFVAEIRQLQPSGPYQLAGFCIGGIVSFEIAQLLRADGEEVSLLALIETWPPDSIPIRPVSTQRFLPSVVRAVSRHIRAMSRLPLRQAFHYLCQKITLIPGLVIHFRGDRGMPSKYASVSDANYRAASRYVPSPYPGHIVLLIPEDRDLEPERDPRFFWGTLAGSGCSVLQVTGDRGSLLTQPHVQVLAEKLRERLHKSQEGTTAPLV